jgi:demethylmenaquinone methyltransferase/2-methoxy-6-polyprenyl-1,4-benzoquinol methylase
MNSREQTQRNYDRMARWYDLFASSERKFTEIGLRMLDARRGERILEIGFGTGHALAELASMVGETGLAVGVELSTGMIMAAQKRIRAQGPRRGAVMLQGDALNLPFAPASFDAIFLSFTLELFENIPVIIEQCKGVLKTHGRIGIVCMALGNSPAYHLYKWGHERWPTILDCRPIQASHYLQGAGFSLKESQTKTMWGLPVDILVAENIVTQ